MWSRYNYFFSKKGRFFLYNSISNGFLEMDEDVYTSMREAFNERRHYDCDDELLSLLRKMKVLDVNDEDEVNQIELTHNLRTFNNSTLQLTINPTLGCNFACPYCFEHDHSFVMMSDETENQIIDFIKKHEQATKLDVTWFGGEPLLGFRRIQSLTHKMMSLGLEYSAHMISNGYLLTDKIINELESLKIRSIQITLDGQKELHDSRRHLVGGGPTFTKILSNIENCQAKSPATKIIIRVNIDKTNDKEFIPLLKEISRHRFSNVHVSPAFVNDCNAECANPNVMNEREKCKFIKTLYSKNGVNFNFFFPGSNRAGCSVRNLNTIVIGPEGELYKCWEDVGDKSQVYGHISGQITNKGLLLRYLNSSEQFKDSKCKKCILLPICAGGCPKHRMLNKYENRHINVCPLMKSSMSDFLYLHFTSKVKDIS